MPPRHMLLTTLSAGLVAFASPADAASPEVTYLPFSDKGISGDEVRKSVSGYKSPRPTPRARFLSPEELSKMQGNSLKDQEREVEFTIQERSNTDQVDLPFSFGFPFPHGELFHLDHLTLFTVGVDSKALPIQLHALALWPDGSVKSALIQTRLDLKAGEEKRLKIAYGNTASKKALSDNTLKITQSSSDWIVDTGAIRVILPTQNFALFSKVTTSSWRPKLIATGGALELQDQNGLLYSSALGPVDSLVVERQGPLEATLRAEGSFYAEKGSAKLMRYIARMRFFKESSRIELTITIINNALNHEFTDLRTLGLGLSFPKSKKWSATIPTGTADKALLKGSGKLALIQWDERNQNHTVDEEIADEKLGNADGGLEIKRSKHPFQLAYKDFWQRWPKRLEVNPEKLRIDFLPPIPDDYQARVPLHTAFPFVEGRHRSKWGMSFTERLALDFNAKNPLSSFQGSLQTAPLVRLPVSYLSSTKVIRSLPTKENEMTRLWRAYSERSMEAFLAHRVKERQYGYFNWGDWYGERGCNWGNNEYDIPHGFFMQYAFTGDGKYFDAAMEGARHQADVDIIHAYPDPFYIGANAQHSIGHTGISYQNVTPKTWTNKYGYPEWGGNGHTWADGMADCWLLTGDSVVMDSLLALGEHMTYAYAPKSKGLGNHHRSIGWCLSAMAAVHRASSDPVHLEEMKLLANLSISQWDSKTGVWPYELHPNHAMQKSGIIGSSVYNLGILLTGLSKYHELTGDDRVPPILNRASDWLVRAVQNNNRGWPYGARADGSLIQPNQPLAENLNALVIPAMAYTAAITDNAEAGRIAQAVLISTFTHCEFDPLPKEFSIKSYATLETIGLLEQSEDNPSK